MAAPERFLADGMLGHVARWLRLLGFDAAYAGSTATDDEVLRRAEQEQRFLATRDLSLVQRAIKRGVPALLLKAGTREEQLLILLMHSGAKVDPANFFTRCTHCSGVLVETPLADVREKVPEQVQATQRRFWRCPDCGHIYWQGSHVTEIERQILDLVRQLASR